MSPKLVEVARFDDLFRAETLKIGLEELGIPAFVEGVETNRAMHYIGTALGGIKVLVPAERKREAQLAIERISLESQENAARAWICPACGEEVDGNFETCWSCRAEWPADAKLAPQRSTSDDDEDEDADVEAIPPRDDEANPYSAPRTTKPMTAAPAGMDSAQVEAAVLRAWRASVIGLFFCPAVLHAYSAYVLIDTRDGVSLLSETGKRRRFWAVMLNTIVILAAVAFLSINALNLRIFSR